MLPIIVWCAALVAAGLLAVALLTTLVVFAADLVRWWGRRRSRGW